MLQKVKSYTKGQRNAGAKGLAFCMNCIDHMFEHGDWTPLAWLITGMDKRDGSIMRSIVREVTGGVSLTTQSKAAKEQPTGIEIKMADNAGPTDKMAILRKMVEEGVSFRSQLVQKNLMDKSANPADLPKYAKAVMRKLDKEGWTIGELLAQFEPAKPSKGQIKPDIIEKAA